MQIRTPRAAQFAVILFMVFGLASVASAQRQQYKIEPSGAVLKLKRVNVTTFRYVPFGQAELRQDGDGNRIWYFQAETGKVYTAPAPNNTPAATRYTLDQLNRALAAARTRGEVPTAASVEYTRDGPVFIVKFEKNTLNLRWQAQAQMSAQEYETLNRALSRQGYRALFVVPYTASDQASRFLAAWRQ